MLCILPVTRHEGLSHYCGISCIRVQELQTVDAASAHLGVVSTIACWALILAALQAKLDVSDDQKGMLRQAMQKYRGELHALAVERKSLNAVLAQAAAPGKPDSIKKVSIP